MAAPLSEERFEQLRTIWVELGGSNVTEAARRLGVKFDTAARYLFDEKACARRGWRPIDEWFRDEYVPAAETERARSFGEIAAENVHMLDQAKIGLGNKLLEKIADPEFDMPVGELVSSLNNTMHTLWRWCGGGAFEQQALGQFMGMVIVVVGKALRDRGLEGEEVNEVLSEIGGELKLLARQGVRGALRAGGGK